MRMQVGRVAATLAVVVAVVSGCGGPGQVGSAVIVGDQAVPLSQVQTQLDTAVRTDRFTQYTRQGGTPATLARDLVSGEVMHILLERRAAAEGIVVTDSQVDAQLAAGGGADAALANTLFDLPTLRERVRDNLIAAEIGRRLVPGLAVTADLVAATSRSEAEQKAHTLAGGGPAADALFTDQRTSLRGAVYQAASSPNEAATVVFGVPVGTVGYFQPNADQSGWIVFRVVDRRTDATADPAAVSSVSQDQLAGIGERAVQQDGEQIGIRVNPRYGEWDPIQLRVVPADQQTGEIFLPQTAATPAAG